LVRVGAHYRGGKKEGEGYKSEQISRSSRKNLNKKTTPTYLVRGVGKNGLRYKKPLLYPRERKQDQKRKRRRTMEIRDETQKKTRDA